MKNENGVSTRLWIEERTNQTTQDKPGANSFASKKIKLDKKLLTLIKQYQKNENVTWDNLIASCFGLLLSRLSSTNIINYSMGELNGSSLKKLSLKSQPRIIDIEVTQETTVKKYLNQSAQALRKKIRKNSGVIPHYLLLFKSKNTIQKKCVSLSMLDYSLVLVADKIKPNEVTLLYSADNFSKSSIEFFAEHMSVLLQSICMADKIAKLHRLNLLTQDERKKITGKWQAKSSQHVDVAPQRCIHDLFVAQAGKTPSNLAVKHNNEQVTYHELLALTTHIADQLMQNGIQSGDNVCVLMDRTPLLLAVMLATFRCGAIFIPINPKYPDERVAYVVNDSKPRLILVNDITKLPKSFHSHALELPGKPDFKPNTREIALPTVSTDSIAYIVYTSGTTGNPKGVMIKHSSLINFSAWYKMCFDLTENDRSSQFASQGFDSFFCETLPFFIVGASVHIVDDSIKLTPSLFFNWLKESKITICDLTTAYAQILFYLPWPDGLSLRLMKIGGEALAHYPSQPFTFDIWNTYGPTEATIEATFKKIYKSNEKSLLATHKEAPSIGKPIINSTVYIVDQFNQLVPPGVVGELLIGGENISAGYLNREELTQQRFITINIDGVETAKLYRTGDLVKWLDNGDIDYVGRIDHQIKIRGYRIEPGEVEHAISLHSDVKETIVVAQNTHLAEKTLIAYVVPNLDKERFLYQQRCLIAVNKDNFFEAITDDISKEGLSVSGVPENLSEGMKVLIHIKLPGMSESKIFKATIVWCMDARCGFQYNLNSSERQIVSKSIDHYLQSHNVMDMILSNSSKRSLQKALKKKMPEYMIPSTFVKLLELPLNYSGKIDVSALPKPKSINDLFKEKYVPPTNNTEKALAKIWEDILGRKNISMSDNFFDIGGNSISAALLSVKILKKFKITIPVKLLFDLSYIPVLSKFIDTKGLKYSDVTEIQDDVRRDGRLDDQIQPLNLLSPDIQNPKHILLTGAAGFLGIYLLRELLKNTDAKIYCLIRQGNFESAAKRLNSTIQNFNLEHDISLANKRIVVISSDLGHDRFGLTKEHYESLENKIDLIYHCGAQVNIMASYGKLRGSNVQGTTEIIKFATKGKDKPIHYVSTLSSAYRKDDSGMLTEEFPTATYEHLFGGYAISKWVSERLLTQIKERGLPVVIYRSGYIFGQSDTGITSLNDALLMLIKGCIQLGYAPVMHEKITLLPVDYVSRAMVDISLAQGKESNVFHIDHPTGIMLSDLVSWLNDYGYKIKVIPMAEWRSRLENIEPDNALFPFLPYYLSLKDDYRSDDVDVTKASRILHELALPYPPIDNALLTTYIDYLCQVGFLPLPEKVGAE